MPPLLEIQGLCVEGRTPRGHWVPTVRGVSLTVAPGEVVALIGESGAGKTTVALASLSYMRPGTRVVKGGVRLDGIDLLALDARARRAARGKDVAYVAQSAQAALNPAITIGEQVAEPMRLHGIATREEARCRAIALLARLDLPDPAELAGRYPHQASGGQQQRVMVAMALTCQPKLLVLDEPTTGLDVTTQIEVLKAIKDVIRTHHSAAMYVSHDLAVVAQIADRIVVMKDGAVVEEGPTTDIIAHPREDYTRELIGAVKPRPVGGSVNFAVRETAPLLTVERLSASFARPGFLSKHDIASNVLQEVDLTIGRREVVALVGESGSGKSTLARVIAGLHAPFAGRVALDGRPLAARARRRDREMLRRIQIIFQSPDLSLNPEQTIGEAIGRPLKLYFGLRGRRRAERLTELLLMVGLAADHAARYPAELSGGQRQRVAIARAFSASPDLVLCDEILSSLDTIVAAQVLTLMRDLRARHDVAYLFISHDLVTVSAIADRVVVLYAGRVCEAGSAASVFSAPAHPYTVLLLASVPELRQGWLEDVVAARPPTRVQTGAAMPRDLGCPFRIRCALAIPGRCDREPPPERRVAAGHVAYCHREVTELRAAP
ncbi:MAG TPA: ABC transporter ATP-binding protein, partial [Stellaceae bacterium]|nr:ABC transporter ATP-binding protein [Stellaceae bacterium]